MTVSKYPDLTFESVFDVYNVGQNMKRDSNYLEDSPYSDMIRKTLKAIYKEPEKDKNAVKATSIDIKDLNIKKETEFLYLETKNLLNSNVLDEKDKAAIIKTATGQMEKLITLIEKADNLRYIREFEARVLEALKKVAPEVREEFLEEIERGEKDE